MQLNLIIHGRAGSTLLSEMLMVTGEFLLWGDRTFANELKEFKRPSSWNPIEIQNSLSKFTHRVVRVMAKLPEFAYFVELLIPYAPNIVVLERSIYERIRSLQAVNWLDKAVARYEEKCLILKAMIDYSAIVGDKLVYSEMTVEQKAALVLAWGNWRTRQVLKEYNSSKVLHLNFDNFMLRREDTYAVLDSFFKFTPKQYWAKWEKIRKKQLQQTGRRNFTPEEYIDSYSNVKDKHKHAIADIVVAFGEY